MQSASERLFLLDFSDQGLLIARLETVNFDQAVRALHSWIGIRRNLQAMQEEHPEFQPTAEGVAFEAGSLIDFRWQQYLHSDEWPHMKPFLKAAFEHQLLGGLFPFFSMQRLRFSRCTGFPYAFSEIPQVRALGPGRFAVQRCDGTPVGEGDEKTALEILEAHLPPNIGRAVDGTWADL